MIKNILVVMATAGALFIGTAGVASADNRNDPPQDDSGPSLTLQITMLNLDAVAVNVPGLSVGIDVG